MKKTLIFLLVFSAVNAFAQKNFEALKITYTKISNGKIVENQDPILAFADKNQTLITSKSIIEKNASLPFEEFLYDRKQNQYFQIATLRENKIAIAADSLSISKQQFEFLPTTKVILGYNCKLAKTIINSNTIEVWYNDEQQLKAAPGILAQELGLVLEVTRNGNYSIMANKVERLKMIPISILPKISQSPTDILSYRDLLWKSRFTQIPIFENETINFIDKPKSNDSILRFANGTIIVRKLNLPHIEMNSRVFIDVSELSAGDAYDRTGSVFIIPRDKQISFLDGLQSGISVLPVYENGNGKKYQGVVRTTNYSPLVELMRFFTPFGIGKYNSIKIKNKIWQDTVFYRQEITDLLPILRDEIWIGANIANYDKGGHQVSVQLTIHPEESTIKETTDFAMPIFSTNNVMEMAQQEYATMFDNANGLEVTFTLDQAISNAKLRYITTGHGGWENGDEFVQKTNTFLLDGKVVHSFIPWRTDCGSYRNYNPASGNFNNGLSSSDYSRSNWCPGTTTNPIYIDLGTLQKGTHTIQVTIPQGEPEGGSFSSWNVSGVLLGNVVK